MITSDAALVGASARLAAGGVIVPAAVEAVAVHASELARATSGCAAAVATGLVGEVPMPAISALDQLLEQARAGSYSVHDGAGRAGLGELLAGGRQLGSVPLGERGFNGDTTLAAFAPVGAADGEPPVMAITKSFGQQAPQELFGMQVGHELGIGHLLAAGARRADGSVAIQLLPGSRADVAGVWDEPSLVRALMSHYADAHGAPAPEAALRAGADSDLLKVLDHVLANGDRHAGNLVVDTSRQLPAAIDFGYVGWGQVNLGGSAEAPALRQGFAGGAALAGSELHRVHLRPITRELLARVDRAAILRAHAQLVEAAQVPGRQMDARIAGAWAAASSPAFGAQAVARLDAAAERGWFDYMPVQIKRPPAMPPLQETMAAAAPRARGPGRGFDRN